MCHHDRFYLTAKDANTGPHASMAGALPTASPMTFFLQAFETQVNFLREVKELVRNPDCQPFGSEGKKKSLFSFPTSVLLPRCWQHLLRRL